MDGSKNLESYIIIITLITILITDNNSNNDIFNRFGTLNTKQPFYYI